MTEFEVNHVEFMELSPRAKALAARLARLIEGYTSDPGPSFQQVMQALRPQVAKKVQALIEAEAKHHDKRACSPKTKIREDADERSNTLWRAVTQTRWP